MAYLRMLKNGSIQATIRLKGINQYRTFSTKEQAMTRADEVESNIKHITTLANDELIVLTDADIVSMGGTVLFNKLGIDLFSVRHAAKLKVINQLSKKQLLQLRVKVK